MFLTQFSIIITGSKRLEKDFSQDKLPIFITPGKYLGFFQAL